MLIARAPDEQVMAAHREFYGERQQAAPPNVRNAEPFAALGEPRALRWRGHAYRVGPLSFATGKRLFVVAQELAATESAASVRVARALLHDTVGHRFADADARELRGILHDLLYLPISTPKMSGDGAPRTVDVLGGFVEFARHFPAFMRDGFPVSWDHYQLGLAYLPQMAARDALRAAEAARAAQADKGGWQGWTHPMRHAAGWYN
jgi:hypothetical protein